MAAVNLVVRFVAAVIVVNVVLLFVFRRHSPGWSAPRDNAREQLGERR